MKPVLSYPRLTAAEISYRMRQLWRIAGEPRNRTAKYCRAARVCCDQEREEINPAADEAAGEIVSAA